MLLAGEPGLASRGCARRCRSCLPTSRMTPCATSARRTTRTAPSTRSSRSSSERPGLSGAITPETGSHKLEAMLAQTASPVADVALLAELLSLPGRQSLRPIAAQSPAKARGDLRGAAAAARALAQHQPVLMIFEDVHWIDPSSRELLDRAVDRAAGLPVLLLITFRPEFQPPWTGRSHVTCSLSAGWTGARARCSCSGSQATRLCPPRRWNEIVKRTDGVPLFVEELTKAVLEAHAGGGHAEGALAGASISALALPATLHASLMARLDRLGHGCQAGGADRSCHRPRVSLRVARRRRRPKRAGAAERAGSARHFWTGVPTRGAARVRLHLQARSGAGCRLQHASAQRSAAAACAHRRSRGAALSRAGRA